MCKHKPYTKALSIILNETDAFGPNYFFSFFFLKFVFFFYYSVSYAGSTCFFDCSHLFLAPCYDCIHFVVCWFLLICVHKKRREVSSDRFALGAHHLSIYRQVLRKRKKWITWRVGNISSVHLLVSLHITFTWVRACVHVLVWLCACNVCIRSEAIYSIFFSLLFLVLLRSCVCMFFFLIWWLSIVRCVWVFFSFDLFSSLEKTVFNSATLVGERTGTNKNTSGKMTNGCTRQEEADTRRIVISYIMQTSDIS